MIEFKKILLFSLSCASSTPLFSAKKLDLKKLCKELSRLSMQERRERLAELRKNARAQTSKKAQKPKKKKKISIKVLKKQEALAARKEARKKEAARLAGLSHYERTKELAKRRRIKRALKQRLRKKRSMKALMVLGGVIAASTGLLGLVGIASTLDRKAFDARLGLEDQIKQRLTAKATDPAVLRDALAQPHAQWDKVHFYHDPDKNSVLDYLIKRHWPEDIVPYQGANVNMHSLKRYLFHAINASPEMWAILEPFIRDTQPQHYGRGYLRFQERPSLRDDRHQALLVVHSLGPLGDQPRAQYKRRQKAQAELNPNPTLRAEARAAYKRVLAHSVQPANNEEPSQRDKELSALHQAAHRRPLPRRAAATILSYLDPTGVTRQRVQPLHPDQHPDTRRGNSILGDLDRRIAELEAAGGPEEDIDEPE